MTACVKCEGTGQVEDLTDPNGPDGWWVEQCPDCGGTGEAPERTGDFTVTLRFHFPTAEARAAWRSENRALLERVAVEVSS